MRLLWVMIFGFSLVAQQADAPSRFESVSIVPAKPGPCNGRFTSTVFVCTGCTLRVLLNRAFGLPDYRVIGPGFLATERFDVSATVPAGGARNVPAMVRQLLEERFHLAVHREQRIMPVMDLMVAKSGLKLREADAPANAAPTPDPDAPVPMLRIPTGSDGDAPLPKQAPTSSLTVRTDGQFEFHSRLTLDSFASALSGLLHKTVRNATQLTGRYQFDFYLRSGSIAKDIESELGLTVEEKKEPVDVIVVDHIDKKPTRVN